MRFFLATLLLVSVPALGQPLAYTYILEAYNCHCGADGRPINSIQLGVRLDRSLTVHTALNTIVGCGRIFLNVDGERYPYKIVLANGEDNVARLEPVDLGMKIDELEKKMKKEPKFEMLTPDLERSGKPKLIVLQGAGMTKQERALPEGSIIAQHQKGAFRYHVCMEARSDSDIDFDQLLGGPLWVEKGKPYLVGLISEVKSEKAQVCFTVTGLDNVLNKGRTELIHAYLAKLDSEEDDCGGRQVYWNGFATYAFHKLDQPSYKRINSKDKWNKSLRTALHRIREHMRDSIPAKGRSREGEPSLCVFDNDLEYAYLAFAEQASIQEQYDWAVLPRFVKAYSNVYCKRRKFSDTEFIRDITELNYRIDRIGADEIRLLYELGYDWNAFEGFVKKYFLLAQVGAIRLRYDRLMEDADLNDPCIQKLMLEELEGHEKNWARQVGVANDPHHERLMVHLADLRTTRKEYVQGRMVAFKKDRHEVQEMILELERDSCVTEPERVQLLKAASEELIDHEKEAIDYGLDVVEEVRRIIERSLGADAMGNVVTKVFRVENGVGIELTIQGGGAILDRRLHGKAGNASDTTTVYRHGYPLGGVGDTLSATIAQVFWDRICQDYASRQWNYRTENVSITGMADGVPVRSTLRFPDACRQELTAQRIVDPNEQLAYARAWSLARSIEHFGDRCGLYSLMEPTISSRTFQERGGQYRGVTLMAVMKKK